MADKYLAIFPSYVMFVPNLTYNEATRRLKPSNQLDFVLSDDKPVASLLAFSGIDEFAAFVGDFPEAKSYGLLPVENAASLARVLLNLKALKGGEFDVRFDVLKSFAGHHISFDSVVSGGTDAAPDPPE